MQLWAVARRGRRKQQASQLKLRRKPGLQRGVGRCYKGPGLPSSDMNSLLPCICFPSRISRPILEPHTWVEILVQPLSSCEIQATSLIVPDSH